ncbi:hypothetical protein FSARC_13418 [Fusarium sarcochroum]|uniref:Heterokaryon incompatibility domain-containing protein n=1 Tax=Fusarium sarcochroum TaxID=1208366 RepID=A0A8H4WTQ6_9HYPO|nr:hypothetical protein FSARC_13418 [Fusarium sarcochroum]
MEDGFTDEEPWLVYPSPTVKSVADCITGWLNSCLKTHHNCKQVAKAKRRDRSSSALPRRLIDLGDRQSKQWRIVQTEGKSRKYGTYCALSHRWSDNTPKLLGKNIEEYHNYQDQGHLPQDYQDIMALCRVLSIRYLWIDSLCILQDSVADFNHEAATMMDIYANAILTFSICWECSDAGLFSQRNRGPNARPGPMPSASRPNVFDSFSNAIPWRVKRLFARREAHLPKCLLFNHEWDINVSDALVNTRGWVLQEKILSARIVYLGNDQLYWECHDCRISESEPYGTYISAGPRQDLYLRTNQPDWLARTSWPETIETYTNCELTYEEDRLTAISGLARCFGRVFRGEYLAGIWADFWIYDLLWDPASAHEENNIRRFRRSVNTSDKPPNIPSWSWAAFPGPVKMHRAENLQMKISYAGPCFTPDGPRKHESDEQMPLAILAKNFERVKDLDRFKEVSSSNGKVQLSVDEPNGEDGPLGLPSLFDDPDGEHNPVGLPGIRLAPLGSRKEREAVDKWRPIRGLIVQERVSSLSDTEKVNERHIRNFFRIGTFMEASTVTRIAISVDRVDEIFDRLESLESTFQTTISRQRERSPVLTPYPVSRHGEAISPEDGVVAASSVHSTGPGTQTSLSQFANNNVFNTTMDIPLSHSSTTGNLLRSAPAKALLGHYPPDLFLHIELRRPIPEGLRLHAVPASQLVHRFHPILDQRAFRELYDQTLEHGPRPDLSSALVLVVLALGTVAAETPNRMDACWSPGIRYFTPAVRLLLTESLSSFGGNALLPQALYLAALYYSYLSRPLLAWRLVHIASTDVQHYWIRSEKLLRDGQGGSQDQSILRVFWAILVLECDILAEHHLPRSGIEKIVDKLPYPWSDGPSEPYMHRWLADLSSRRLLNRIHYVLYAEAEPGTGDGAVDNSEETLSNLPNLAHELNRQLGAWYHLLPHSIRPNLEVPPIGIDDTMVTIRYHTTGDIIYRPFLYQIFECSGTCSSRAHSIVRESFTRDHGCRATAVIRCLFKT